MLCTGGRHFWCALIRYLFCITSYRSQRLLSDKFYWSRHSSRYLLQIEAKSLDRTVRCLEKLTYSVMENNGATSSPPSNRKKEDSSAEHVTCVGEDIEQLPASFVAAHSARANRLDLSYNKLKSLKGLEKFTLLEELVLDNNQLTDESISVLPLLPSLHTLTLNNNKIADIDELIGILNKSCPKLRYLSLLSNQACPHELLGKDHDDEDYQRYRYYVLYKVPRLTFLDSRSVTASERAEARRKGQFTRVVRPDDTVFEDSGKKASSQSSGYTPLPQTTHVAGQHRAVFGTCKYVYYGKHSEGNRFIRNNQL